MHKKNFQYSCLTLTIIMVNISILFLSAVYSQDTSVEQHYKMKTIVIDPGHGGKDPGSVGKNGMEKDVVLAISLKLGKYIEEKLKDVNVLYTRTSDEFIPLYKRAEIANQNHADLFISIHANGLTNSQAYGALTLVLGWNREDENFEVAKRENAVIKYEEDYTTRYEGFDPESIESYMMMKLMQKTYFNHSVDFAKYVQDQFRDRAQRKDLGVRHQGLLVLAQTSMPGVLVETGFITNEDEEKYLLSEDGQDIIASAIFRAFKDYKSFIESRSVGSVLTNISSDSIKYPDQLINTTIYAGDSLIGNLSDNIISDIVFKVQITTASVPIPLNSELFNNLENIQEIQINNLFKYAVGEKRTYSEIIEYGKQIKNRFPDAFVIALKNGSVIPIEQAIKETSN